MAEELYTSKPSAFNYSLIHQPVTCL